MQRILFNITHGFQARMLLHSKINETLLAQGVELIIVSPNAEEEYFRREFDHPQIRLEKMPSRFSRVESLLINLRQYLLMNPSLGHPQPQERSISGGGRRNSIGSRGV